MYLTIVSGTRNRPGSLRRFVDSVLRLTSVDYELIIADASDVPCNVEQSHRIRVLEERPRLGYALGYNRAFATATGKWVMFLNDDCEVMPGYDSEAVRFMESHPQIGIGALHYSENGGPFHVNSSWNCIYPNFGIISRQLGQQIGWMDPDISFYGSDNAIAFKVLLADKGVADIPDARILHHSVQDAERQANQANRLRDNQTLTRKYMPLRNQWLAAYRRHAVSSHAIPWSHGQMPVASAR